jgi:hypothetical protein
MHLLCRDTECPGNDLPAGTHASETCRFCGLTLEDEHGAVLAQGAAPLVAGSPPRSFDALMDALRDAGADVQVVELTAVRQGDQLLVSAVSEDGELLSAEVCDGARAEGVEHVMELLDQTDG